MADKPLNVLLLTVDALRADRTSLHGYDRPTTPTLEKLAKNAIVCDRAFSLGPFTQSAAVQMFTSTRPLSYGGYDHGAKGRPPSLFKHLKEVGYETTNLVTLHWVNRYFGYGDGVDNEIHLFTLNTLPGIALAMVRNTLKSYEGGELTNEEMLSKVEPILMKFFADALDYCESMMRREHELAIEFPDSALVNGQYDYAKVGNLITRHRNEFVADCIGYIRKHLIPVPAEDWMKRWLPREWRYYRKKSKLITQGLHELGNRAIGLFNPPLARARRQRFKIYPDSPSLADKIISTLESHKGEKPFCLWVHFYDTHMPYVSGRGRYWYRQTPDYLEKLGYPRDLDPTITFTNKPRRREDWDLWSALYDTAVLTIDEEIGRIIASLDRLELRDNTLVVIAGDHGEELGEHGGFGHFFLLYDHNTRMPMMFHHPGLKRQRIEGLTTILDLPATVADLVGIGPAPGWEGLPVTDPSVADRSQVICETFYGGNCLFEQRPLYFGLRTKSHLYLWKEYLDPADEFSPPGHELYDSIKDPIQQQNLYRPDHPLVSQFNAIIAERMAEIPEITDQRIVDCFGAIGSVAIKRG